MFDDTERGSIAGVGGKVDSFVHVGGASHRGGPEAMDVNPPPSGGHGGAPGIMDDASISHQVGRAVEDESRAYVNEDRHEIESRGDGGDNLHMEALGGGQGVPRRSEVGTSRLWQ